MKLDQKERYVVKGKLDLGDRDTLGKEEVSKSQTGRFEGSLIMANGQGMGLANTEHVFGAFLLAAYQRIGPSLRNECAVFLGTHFQALDPTYADTLLPASQSPLQWAAHIWLITWDKSEGEHSCDVTCFPPVAYFLFCIVFLSPLIFLKANWLKARWGGGSW